MNPLIITNLLAPCFPFLLKKIADSTALKSAASTALESAASKLGEDTWAKAREIWQKLQPKINSNPPARMAVEKLAEQPDNETWQNVLTEELDSILKNEPTLAKAIAEIIGESASNTGTTNNIQQTVRENKGQLIGQANNSKNVGSINSTGGDVNF